MKSIDKPVITRAPKSLFLVIVRDIETGMHRDPICLSPTLERATIIANGGAASAREAGAPFTFDVIEVPTDFALFNEAEGQDGMMLIAVVTKQQDNSRN